MRTRRATLVVRGQVVVAAESDGLRTAEAIGIADGRVVAVGSAEEIAGITAPGARVVDAGRAAVVPGLHDFHIHLVGLARTRHAIPLDDAADGAEVVARVVAAVATGPTEGWLTGRGWSERHLAGSGAAALGAAVGERLAFLTSHDGHSAWASPAALRLAGVGGGSLDPPGGRIERGPAGEPTGVLRETATELVSPHVSRPQGEALRPALDATLRDLAGRGITGATEAGDYTDRNGIGVDAALGDSYSSLTDLGDLVDGRLRLSIGIPADALGAASERGLRTGSPLAGRASLRFGWAKQYADGALGSGTAALYEPKTCGDPDVGILRVSAAGLDRLFAAGRAAGIGLAVHAIGDRAAATVLDAVERAPRRPPESPRDRIEHAQLLRPVDAERFERLGVTASIQPIHAAADRDLVEACWDGRQADAYAWRTLLRSGTLLAAGSDAPVESVDPWLGVYAAVHRRLPADGTDDWRPAQAMTPVEALAAYTIGPARALGVADEGHLRVGARADLAVLDVDVDALLAADERLGGVRSVLTLVSGVEVPLA